MQINLFQLEEITVLLLLIANPSVEAEELDAAWREFLRQQRSTLNDLHAKRTISDEIYSQLATRIDKILASREITWNQVNDLNAELWQLHEDPPAAQT